MHTNAQCVSSSDTLARLGWSSLTDCVTYGRSAVVLWFDETVIAIVSMSVLRYTVARIFRIVDVEKSECERCVSARSDVGVTAILFI